MLAGALGLEPDGGAALVQGHAGASLVGGVPCPHITHRAELAVRVQLLRASPLVKTSSTMLTAECLCQKETFT